MSDFVKLHNEIGWGSPSVEFILQCTVVEFHGHVPRYPVNLSKFGTNGANLSHTHKPSL